MKQARWRQLLKGPLGWVLFVVGIGLFWLAMRAPEPTPRPAQPVAPPVSLASQVSDAVRANGDGSLRRATCLKRTERVYRCSGFYRPSKASIRERFVGQDVAERDIDTLYRRERAGYDIALTVTLDPDTGDFLYEFG